MKRNIAKPIIAAAGIAALTLGASGIAGAAAPTLNWDQATNTMSLTINTPGDSVELYVGDPATGAVFGTATGSSGVLTVVVPAFCGTVQGDVIGNGKKLFGHQYTDESCPTPTTTTTTTTTTAPIVMPTTVPPNASPPAVVSTASVPPAPPAGPVTESLSGAPGAEAASANGPTLPFTGANYPLLAGIGSAASLIGIALMRRRGLRWKS